MDRKHWKLNFFNKKNSKNRKSSSLKKPRILASSVLAGNFLFGSITQNNAKTDKHLNAPSDPRRLISNQEFNSSDGSHNSGIFVQIGNDIILEFQQRVSDTTANEMDEIFLVEDDGILPELNNFSTNSNPHKMKEGLVKFRKGKQSHLDTKQIPLILNLTGGGYNETTELGLKMVPNQVPQQMKNSQYQPSKDTSSSSYVSNMDQSSNYPGNNVRYSPSGDPGGSGSGKTGPEAMDWETKASCPNPDEVISDPNFWNSYLNSKNCCPKIDIKFDNQEEWAYEDRELIEIPDEVLSKQRRRLFGIPTAKLDRPVKQKHNYSIYDLHPFKVYSKEGIVLTFTNKELEKIVYAPSDDLYLLNFADKIGCPIQPDPNKYQRTECRTITNVGKKDALIRILELTTSADPSYLTRKIPMPSYPFQDALVYIDTSTGGCVFFHADNGKLWSAGKLSPLEISAILNNPDFENLNSIKN